MVTACRECGHRLSAVLVRAGETLHVLCGPDDERFVETEEE